MKGKVVASAGRKQRVLVVDDHPCVQMALRMIINGEPDWEVCGVEVDAKPALAAVEKLKPDLVIVDLMLPGSHGLDLISRLKNPLPPHSRHCALGPRGGNACVVMHPCRRARLSQQRSRRE